MSIPWRLFKTVVRVLRLPGVPQGLTAATLAGLAGAHGAWAGGSAFPFTTREELAEAMVGADEVPGPAACATVAGLLGGAALLVAGVPVVPPRWRRVGLGVITGVLAVRGALGLTGATGRLVRGAGRGERFRRLDRSYYGPLCLGLAAGAGTALVRAVRPAR
jgi:hypothetical protein